MKQGMTLQQLAAESIRIKQSARDFVVPVKKMHMADDGTLGFGDHSGFGVNNWSAGQIAWFAGIPKQYFERLRVENPALFAANVNHGISRKDETEERMVRTLDGNVRALLSSKYRRLDSSDLLETILPILMDEKHGFEVASTDITEQSLYLKVTTPKVQAEVTKGDIVQYGLAIQTSDVGAGAFKIEPFFNRLVCTNGMIMSQAFRKMHIGRNVAEGDIRELLSDETKALDDAAFFATVRDVTLSTMREDIFNRELDKMRLAAEQKIERRDLDEVVELSMKTVGVGGVTVKHSILEALMSGNQGAGLTKWGLANSFTAAAKSDAINYDTATQLERAGGQIIELEGKAWQRIAQYA